MPELSIIIVNYRNQELVLDCVQSILEKEQNLSFEIIVVDNCSEDDTEIKLKSLYPQLKWIQMGYNSGFGRANNAGIKAATGKYLLLLNSDVFVKEKDTILRCVQHLQHLPNAEESILGTRLVNADGSFQETLRLTFPGIQKEIRANALYILIFDRLLKRNRMTKDKDERKEAHSKSGFVAWINAAFLLMNREVVLRQKLYFDEDFFLYSEDVEWCSRATKSGMKFYHWHEAELIHLGSASSNSMKTRIQQIQASEWLYFRKSRGFFYAFAAMSQVWKNQVLDSLLYRFAKLRGKAFNEGEIIQREQRSWTFQNLKRFFLVILFRRKLSDDKSFVVNCYQHPVKSLK